MFGGSGNPGGNPFAPAFGAPATTAQSSFTAGGFSNTSGMQPAAFGSGGFGSQATNAQSASFGSGGFGGSATTQSTAFGTGGFGTSATAGNRSAFGTGGFGSGGFAAASTTTSQVPAFGSGGFSAPATGSIGFGAVATSAQPPLFGSGGFGSTATSSQPPSFGSGGFGTTTTSSTKLSVHSTGAFGAPSTAFGSGGFGSTGTGSQPPAFGSGGFGATTTTTSSQPPTFGSGGFGAVASAAARQNPFGSGGFGATATSGQSPAFGAGGFAASKTGTSSSSGATGMFGTSQHTTAPPPYSAPSSTAVSTSTSASASPSLFASTASAVFGSPVAPTSFPSPKAHSPKSGSATSTFPPSLFGSKETKATPATLAASIFGGNKSFTNPSDSAKTVPTTRSNPSTGAFSNSTSGLFTNAASALAGSSRFGQQQSAPPATTTAQTVFSYSPSFGSVAGTGKTEAGSVFPPANKVEASSSRDNQQTSSKNRPAEVLFGKAVAGASAASTPDDQPVTKTLFGKPIDVEKKAASEAPVQALFGKQPVTEKTNKGDDTSLSPTRRPIQRGGPSDSRKHSPPNLFGCALAGVTKEDKKPVSLPWRQKRGVEDEHAVEKDTEVSFESRSRMQQRVAPSVVRRKSREDDIGRVGIICKGVPPGCNKKEVLRKHFEKYGRVVRVFPNSTKGTATIHFENPDSAARAKKNGGRMKKGAPEMAIFWSSYRKPTSEEPIPESRKSASRSETSSRSPNRPTSRERQDESHRPTTSKPVRSFLRNEVDDELQSMMGTSDITTERVRILERPEEGKSHEIEHDPAHHSGEQTRPRSVSPTSGLRKSGRESKSHSDRRKYADDDSTRAHSSSRDRTSKSERTRSSSPAPHSGMESKSQVSRIKQDIERPARPRSASPSHTREHVPKSQVTKVKDDELKSQRPRSMSPTYHRETSPTRPPTKLGTESVSLKSLANTVAQSSTDRLAVLETIDKLVKQAMNTQDKKISHVRIGTCPDMCPEKERYLRECRRLLTPFESIPGSDTGQGLAVNHLHAVKEYSRSSADQEMPLPHELRPAPVLDITMTYLLNNIMDLGGDGKWENWYEFMWNRTRAIRKDITQQALCDLTTVGLVEKCARFHIFCAERLCEEDFNVFDMKINNENLTKCLQTLKELYTDLGKKDVVCPNEAEFRAYLVLMNLNEGDILREVQQLPDHIRHAPVMKFVLKVHAALYNLNYVRFFKLVQQANFPQASILHRYFGQIRQQAILIMIKVYSTPSKGHSFPLSDLVRLLAFEDEGEAQDFCRHHGLMCEEGQVLLERQSFVQPEMAFAPRRAPQLIETKQTASAGEIVNGGPLPPNDIHQPTMSFDDQGRFQLSKINIPIEIVEATHEITLPASEEMEQQPDVLPQETATTSSTETPEISSADQPIHPAMLAVPNDIVKDIAKNLFIEVIQDMCVEMSTSFLRLIKFMVVASTYTIGDVVDDVTKPMIREVCEDVIKEKQDEDRKKEEALARERREEARLREAQAREAEARRRAAEAHTRRLEELARKKKIACNEIVEELTDEVVTGEGKAVAQEVTREIKQQLRESRERATTVVADELLDSCVEEEMSHLFKDYYQKQVVERREKLATVERAVCIMRMSRYFKRWRDELIGRQRLKRSMFTFPPGPSLELPRQQLQTLIPDSKGVISPHSVHLGKTARLTIDPPNKLLADRAHIINKMAAYRYLQEAKRQLAWAPLDVVSSVSKRIIAKHTPETISLRCIKEMDLYWKLSVGLPEVARNKRTVDDLDTSDLCEWMVSKLKRGAVSRDSSDDKSELLSAYSQRIESTQPSILHICIRAAHGCFDPVNIRHYYKAGHFMGTNAVIFVANIPEEEKNMKNWWLEERLRLNGLFEAKPSSPSIPLAVFVRHTGANGPMEQLVEKELTLPLLVADGAVSEFKVFEIDDLEDVQTSQLLSTALSWLAEECPQQPEISVEPLVDFIEDAFAREFYGPVYQNLAKRRQTGYLDQAPDLLVCLYNHLIQHLKDVVTSPELNNISWPVTEFVVSHPELPQLDWNGDSRETIADLILEMTLPEFEITESGDWDTACADVWAFIATVTEDSSHTNIKLISKVRWLLRQAKSNFDDLCWLVDREDNHSAYYVNLPWSDIILACIDHQIMRLKIKISQLQEEDVREMRVHYWPHDLNSYTLPAEWLASTKVKHPASHSPDEDEELLGTTISRATKRKLSDTSPVTPPNKISRQTPQGSQLDFSVSTPIELEAHGKAHELINKLAVEKRKANEFEDYLQQALDGGTGSRSLPLTLSPIRQEKDRPSVHQPQMAFTPFRTPQPVKIKMASSPTDQQKPCLEDGIEDLKASIRSQRQADKLYEMKLQALLVSQSVEELFTS